MVYKLFNTTVVHNVIPTVQRNLHVLKKLRQGELGRWSALVTRVVKALMTSPVEAAGLFETAGALTANTYVTSSVSATAD